MSNKDNFIDLSKIIKNPKPKEAEPIHIEPTFLSELFKEPTDLDPVEKLKAREARFREAREGGKSTKNTPPTSSTFTK